MDQFGFPSPSPSQVLVGLQIQAWAKLKLKKSLSKLNFHVDQDLWAQACHSPSHIYLAFLATGALTIIFLEQQSLTTGNMLTATIFTDLLPNIYINTVSLLIDSM